MAVQTPTADPSPDDEEEASRTQTILGHLQELRYRIELGIAVEGVEKGEVGIAVRDDGDDAVAARGGRNRTWERRQAATPTVTMAVKVLMADPLLVGVVLLHWKIHRNGWPNVRCLSRAVFLTLPPTPCLVPGSSSGARGTAHLRGLTARGFEPKFLLAYFRGKCMKIQVSGDVVSRNLMGEAVLLDLATGTYFGLDEVGTRVWQLLEQHGSNDAVVAALLEEYAVDEPRARADVDRLILELSEKGLVRIDEASTP